MVGREEVKCGVEGGGESGEDPGAVVGIRSDFGTNVKSLNLAYGMGQQGRLSRSRTIAEYY